MGLEAVTGIWDFNPSWPLGTDKRRQGDDHLRAIKLGVKNTLPNITEPITVTADFLNGLAAVLVAQITPVGTIIMWDIANHAVPSGWHLCDGSTVTDYGVVPDLRNRFIVGSGGDYAAGATGGADTQTSSQNGGHDHGGAAGDHTLDTTQIPAHVHTGLVFTGSNADNGTSGTLIETAASEGNGTHTNPDSSVGSTGGGLPHNHTISSVLDHTHTVDVRPRYYAAVFIVKVVGYTP